MPIGRWPRSSVTSARHSARSSPSQQAVVRMTFAP